MASSAPPTTAATADVVEEVGGGGEGPGEGLGEQGTFTISAQVISSAISIYKLRFTPDQVVTNLSQSLRHRGKWSSVPMRRRLLFLALKDLPDHLIDVVDRCAHFPGVVSDDNYALLSTGYVMSNLAIDDTFSSFTILSIKIAFEIYSKFATTFKLVFGPMEEWDCSLVSDAVKEKVAATKLLHFNTTKDRLSRNHPGISSTHGL